MNHWNGINKFLFWGKHILLYGNFSTTLLNRIEKDIQGQLTLRKDLGLQKDNVDSMKITIKTAIFIEQNWLWIVQ